jgi:uncharacterized membrane protein
VLGAFQVAPGFRQHHPRWHRLSGRVLVPAGITAALSGLWMATYYAGVNSDLLYSFRIVFGLLWVVFLGIGVAAILRRDIATHRAFMIRSFAIALGASTQALIFIPVAAMGIEPSDLGSDLLMGAAWGINLLLAEWIIRGRPGLARPVKAAVGG